MDPEPHEHTFNSEGLLIPTEAAAFVRLSPRTLEKRRTQGGGPAFVRLGRRVLYEKQALLTWISKNRIHSTAEIGRPNAA